jgi:hypothetical protein
MQGCTATRNLADIREILNRELYEMYVGMEDGRNTAQERADARVGALLVERIAATLRVQLRSRACLKQKALQRLASDPI